MTELNGSRIARAEGRWGCVPDDGFPTVRCGSACAQIRYKGCMEYALRGRGVDAFAKRSLLRACGGRCLICENKRGCVGAL
eukprot:1738839-Prymnesium_polylepis.1